MSYNDDHAAAPRLPGFEAIDPGESRAFEDRGREGLARTLSRLRYCSVREALALIAQGRVTVDGCCARTIDQRVDPRRACIAVDDLVLTSGRTIRLMINKPRGLAVTRRNPEARRTVHGCLPPDLPFLSPVGRLEKASEGLLFMTNDTAWADLLLDPASGVTSRYHVRLDQSVDTALLDACACPAMVGRDMMRTVSTRSLDTERGPDWFEIVLATGSDRCIRRVLAARGATVLRLVRVAIGDVMLGALDEGRIRPINTVEADSLTAAGAAIRH